MGIVNNVNLVAIEHFLVVNVWSEVCRILVDRVKLPAMKTVVIIIIIIIIVLITIINKIATRRNLLTRANQGM